MVNVNWASADRDPENVELWEEKPKWDEKGGVWFGERIALASINRELFQNAPEPGECVRVSSYETMRLVFAREWKHYLVRIRGGFMLASGPEPPTMTAPTVWNCGSGNWLANDLSAEVADLLVPNHGLEPDHWCEVPRR